MPCNTVCIGASAASTLTFIRAHDQLFQQWVTVFEHNLDSSCVQCLHACDRFILGWPRSSCCRNAIRESHRGHIAVFCRSAIHFFAAPVIPGCLPGCAEPASLDKPHLSIQSRPTSKRLPSLAQPPKLLQISLPAVSPEGILWPNF